MFFKQKTAYEVRISDLSSDVCSFDLTHHGFFAVGPDGVAQQISETEDDFMGFTPHPSDPDVLYASGHPAGGGNLGFIVSRNGGQTWTKPSEGAGSPVDFPQMDASQADPRVDRPTVVRGKDGSDR